MSFEARAPSQPEPEPAPNRSRRPPVARYRTDALLLAAAILVFVLSALPIRPNRVPGLEEDVFRAINSTVTVPFVLVWPVMQLGNFLVIPPS